MPLSEPEIAIGPYVLLGKVGEGGMGVVHLARDPAGRHVAVKLLRPHIIGDEQGRARLAREVTSLRRVRSPRVAEVYDADPWGDTPYLVTRYVPGPSLQDHIDQRGPIRGPDLDVVARGLAEALVAVHAADVLHRDVKPSNVLLEGREPVLIDFGLAQLSDDSRMTHSGWLLGTPGYLAPETLYGEDPTTKADVHSWAATLVFAATGRGPYGKGPAVAVMDRVRRGEHDLSGLPDALYWLVRSALMPDPRDRPTAAEVVAWVSGSRVGHQRPQPSPDAHAVASAPTGATRIARLQPVGPQPAQPSAAPPLGVSPPRQWQPAGHQPGTPGQLAPTSRVGPAGASPASFQPVAETPARRTVAPGVSAAFWLSALALVMVGAATAPAATAVALFLGSWTLRTVTVRSDRLVRWRTRRGPRRGDSWLATLCAPWFGVLALPGAVINAVAALLGSAAAVGILTLTARPRMLVWILLFGGLVAGVLTWCGPFSSSVRRGGRTLSSWMLRPGMEAVLAVFAVLAVAVAVVLVRQVGGPSYTPLPAPPWEQALRDLLSMGSG